MSTPSRAAVLQLAILGLLRKQPMHGYELRKQLNAMLGPFRAFSYGSLYPGLRQLSASASISASDPASGSLTGRRAKIVYTITTQGAQALEAMLGEAGPASWEDENFDVRFAFFAQTDRETRLRILEGRKLRMAERLDALRAAGRGREIDHYTRELHSHGIDQLEREVHWLDGLIEAERAARGLASSQSPPVLTQHPTNPTQTARRLH
ncbi:MAG: PadR family transcriptional regulator [Bifidobacteriaceae bacterium]|jgi:DNA-binding PadR family transcriptional regulator|nr:PadR family transcriptional regulator [Bifidobacteriaceae bacterium]